MNDKLRVHIALGALANEDRVTARAVLNEMSSAPSFSEYLDLWAAGLYGNVLFYVLILGIPLVMRYAYEIFSRHSKKAAAKRPSVSVNVKHARVQTNESADTSRIFVTAPAGGQLNPQYEEYIECLKVFGLEVGADLKAIKMAYRNAVKEIHPDLHANNVREDANTKFVEYTQTYDRVRELHQIFNGSS